MSYDNSRNGYTAPRRLGRDKRNARRREMHIVAEVRRKKRISFEGWRRFTANAKKKQIAASFYAGAEGYQPAKSRG